MNKRSVSRIAAAILVIGGLWLSSSQGSAATYQSIVLGDSPLAYYRLGETAPVDLATNRGSLGAGGNGTYRHDSAGQTTIHRVTGALAGNTDAAASFQSSHGAPVLVPHNAALNPRGAFTVEAWVNPTAATDDSV